jgi:hypothetical protein
MRKMIQYGLICGSIISMVSGCAYTQGGSIRKNAPAVALTSIKNYSEYPYGEEILTGMIKSVILDHNMNLVSVADAKYTIEAELNEFNYKEGVAGEGAASVTVRLFKDNALIQSETSSKSGFGRESVAEILHKALRKAVGKLNVKK